MDNKQAILGFTEFFKGITDNQNLEIPSEIAEKCGIQAQADGEYINRILKRMWNWRSKNTTSVDKVAMEMILREELPSVAMPTKTGHCEWQTEDENLYVIHELKILPEYYDEVVTGRKNFELRKDDRNYKVGDLIRFHEYKDGEYTGKESILIPILYILRNCPEYGLMDGYCILGL